MKNSYRLILCALAICCMAILPADAAQKGAKKAGKGKAKRAMAAPSDVKLPEMVQKTLDAKFPNAAIEKAESANEGGVTVWDIKFREGKNRKGANIAEDGTMLGYAVVIGTKTIPKPARRLIDNAIEDGAKTGRMERIEITYEAKDGKVVKLDKPVTHYSIEMTKDKEDGKIILDANGKVVSAPKWHTVKPKAAKAAKAKAAKAA
jgi:hypothetical protein